MLTNSRTYGVLTFLASKTKELAYSDHVNSCKRGPLGSRAYQQEQRSAAVALARLFFRTIYGQGPNFRKQFGNSGRAAPAG